MDPKIDRRLLGPVLGSSKLATSLVEAGGELEDGCAELLWLDQGDTGADPLILFLCVSFPTTKPYITGLSPYNRGCVLLK